jgi:nitrogen fixation NifU-like protein
LNLYRDLIIDHYRNPRNTGQLKNADGEAKEANATCGDLVEFAVQIRLLSANSYSLKAVKWRSVGCAISTAAASLLSERVKEIDKVDKIKKLTEKDMVEILGGEITPARIKCATLPLAALKKALENAEI